MTLSPVASLIDHATILEMNVKSYRRRAALQRKRGRGRPPTHANTKTHRRLTRRDNLKGNALARATRRAPS